MNVKQLIEALSGLPDDLPVLVSRDEEGNGFHHLAESVVGYVEDPIDQYHFEDVESEATEAYPNKVVVLWP